MKDSITDPSPWVPMTKLIDLKHLGKLGEELNECGAAVSRCIIQGIEESEPVTLKPNREWLEDEIADVLANIYLVQKHFKLNQEKILARRERKITHLTRWHNMLSRENV